MLIDWFTVGAQIINFLILVGLLKYFFYDRILSAMDKREEKIADRLRTAEKERQEAEEKSAELTREREELEQKRRELIRQARDEADERKAQWLNEAREDTEAARRRWRQSVADERDDFIHTLREEAAREIVEISRAALEGLAGRDLQRQAVDTLLRKLEEPEAKERLRSVVEDSSNGVVVQFAHTLGGDQRDAIEAAIRKAAGEETRVEFEEEPDLICGLEIRAGGRTLGWSIHRYLDRLSETMRDALDEGGHGEEGERIALGEDESGPRAAREESGAREQ